MKVIMNKKTTLKVDLDEKLDLSTYCPEKALHLDMEKRDESAVNKLNAQIVELEMKRHVLIKRKLAEKGWERKELARKAFKLFPEQKDFGKFCKKLYAYLETGKDDGYVELGAICSVLDIAPSESQISTSSIFRYQKRFINEYGIIAFRNQFSLIWKYREAICHTPELSNITDEHLGAGASFAGLAKIPLGALLIKYNDGQLRCGRCIKCNCETLGYYTVRGLSGHGYHWEFCPNCGKDFPKLEQRLDELFYNKIQLCPKIETSWTMLDLISFLKQIEERRVSRQG